MEQAHEQGQDAFVADLQIIHAAGRRLEAFINDNFQGVRTPETPAAITAQQAVPIRQEPAVELTLLWPNSNAKAPGMKSKAS